MASVRNANKDSIRISKAKSKPTRNEWLGRMKRFPAFVFPVETLRVDPEKVLNRTDLDTAISDEFRVHPSQHELGGQAR